VVWQGSAGNRRPYADQPFSTQIIPHVRNILSADVALIAVPKNPQGVEEFRRRVQNYKPSDGPECRTTTERFRGKATTF